jgi:hypothetical protein
MFTKEGDNEHIHIYRNEIRRKVHTMLAFIRQNTRESHVGFQPNSSEADTPFHVGNNYVRDPTRPRLCDLLTPAEVEAYGRVMVSARAACVASEIKGIVQLLAKHVDYNIMVRAVRFDVVYFVVFVFFWGGGLMDFLRGGRGCRCWRLALASRKSHTLKSNRIETELFKVDGWMD